MTKAILGIAFPRISTYGSRDDGKNTTRIDFGNIELYFSYETLVAYRDEVDGLVVCQNKWSMTTGKHLNDIDGGNKEARLPKREFDHKVGEMTIRHSVREIEIGDYEPFGVKSGTKK